MISNFEIGFLALSSCLQVIWLWCSHSFSMGKYSAASSKYTNHSQWYFGCTVEKEIILIKAGRKLCGLALHPSLPWTSKDPWPGFMHLELRSQFAYNFLNTHCIPWWERDIDNVKRRTVWDSFFLQWELMGNSKSNNSNIKA